MMTTVLLLATKLLVSAPPAGKPAVTPPPPAVAAKAERPDPKAVRFVLDASQRIYKLGVNFAYQTTIFTPVNCAPPIVGDPEYFLVLVPDETGRRFIVSAKQDQPGSTTNVTFSCDEGVRFSVEVTQVPQEQAALIAEFELNPDESARVRAVIDNERKRCGVETQSRIEELQAEIERETEERLAKGMLRRLTLSHDIEAARESFVIVRVTNELLAGERGFIVFSVQNRTSKEIVVKDVEVLTDKGGQPMGNVMLVMPERRVGADAIQFAVAVFDAPEDVSSLVLVVHEDGPRVIRVGEIDF